MKIQNSKRETLSAYLVIKFLAAVNYLYEFENFG